MSLRSIKTKSEWRKPMPGLTSMERMQQPEAPGIAMAAARAGEFPPVFHLESPEPTGDFSFDTDFQRYPFLPGLVEEVGADSPAVSVIGDHLPSIVSQEERLALMQESELMGELMQQARLSRLTACILRPDLYRNKNGYSKVKSKMAKEIGLNSYIDIQRAAYFLNKVMLTGELPTDEEKKKQVEHSCRFGACGNPDHYRLVTNKENNQLKNKAAKIEPLITSGQIFYAVDLFHSYPWLEDTVIEEGEELPRRVISAKLGPFALRSASPPDGLFYGERLPDEIYELLRPLGKSNYVAPSRAKKPKPLKGQKAMYRKDKFTKKTPLPTQKDRYLAAMEQF